MPDTFYCLTSTQQLLTIKGYVLLNINNELIMCCVKLKGVKRCNHQTRIHNIHSKNGNNKIPPGGSPPQWQQPIPPQQQWYPQHPPYQPPMQQYPPYQQP